MRRPTIGLVSARHEARPKTYRTSELRQRLPTRLAAAWLLRAGSQEPIGNLLPKECGLSKAAAALRYLVVASRRPLLGALDALQGLNPAGDIGQAAWKARYRVTCPALHVKSWDRRITLAFRGSYLDC
jgi:hypothetical protein